VIIGSREQEKAERTAAELNSLLGKDAVRGMLNPHAAHKADVVILTVPYAAHRATLESVHEQVQGKILVDVTVPIQPPKITVVALPAGRTAAEEAQAILGENVRVVSAFQNVSATHLMDVNHPVNCDVLICGDDKEAKQVVIALAEAAGMRGIDAGPLANAIVAESLTPVLLGINKRYGVKGAGIRITEIG
jgi:NADPH-dependent F420 reductase